MNNVPVFTVQRKSGNNTDKILLPLNIENFDDNKYSRLITFEHESNSTKKDMDKIIPLLHLKITKKFNPDNNSTVEKLDEYFNFSCEVNDEHYVDNKKPKILQEENSKTFQIQIKLEQKKSLKTQIFN
ncbi:hypothetical protein AshY1_04820 [Candidatus Phytoplasma fraxini]|uniref:Uncharacterized protein n=2 Tax=Ash yellows phytoplasma TaxID=35780 RepID=A0ABZ2U8Y4_ASHYP